MLKIPEKFQKRSKISGKKSENLKNGLKQRGKFKILTSSI